MSTPARKPPRASPALDARASTSPFPPTPYSAAQSAAKVAKIGNVEYATLADAVAAANESEDVTIKMLKDYTTADNESIVFTKNATLDLNDTTLTFSDGQRYGKKLAVGTLNATTPEVTFQNGTIVFACYPDDTACGRGVNVFGTLNVACTITQTCDNPAKTGQPIFDCYGASVVNIGEGAVIEGLYGDVFRTKDDVTDEPDVTINITGGSVMSAHSDDGIFYLMKPAPAMVANITGGELSFKTSAFAKRNYQTLKCELDDTCGAKFDCNTGNLADYIKSGYEAVLGDDELYTIQAIPSFDVTFTVDEEEIPDSTTNVLRDTTLTAEMIPDVTDLEGAWDVNPVGAIITCETNFNFTTVKYVTITLPQTLPEGVTALVVSQSVDGVEWELVEGNQIVKDNFYVVVATADEGYTIQNPIKSGTADDDIEVTDTDFEGKITPPAPAIDVAKIGDTFYKDLHEALTAAKAKETVEIIADIDLKNAEWTPVAFTGKTLLGNSHIISNLNVVGTSGYAGFISDASTSKIRDLVIENVTVDAAGCTGVGAVAGYFDSGSLASNVTVCGRIQVTGYKYVGGIVGNSGNGSDKIIDCSVIGDGAATSFIQIPTTGDGQVGGIAGYAAAVKVFGCKVQNLTVVGPGKVGGLLGRHHNGCDAVNCSVSNVIVKSDATHMGAAVGQCGENAPYLINCEVTDTVLQGMDGSEKPFAIYGTKLTAGKAYVYATNVVGQTMNAYASKYNFTAGDFNIDYEEDGVTAVEADLADGYELVATEEEGWYTIQKAPVAEIVDGDRYATLGEAIAALTGGETIKLLANYTAADAENLVFTKSATLDLGDFELTLSAKLLSAKLFKVADGASVSFENGTITMGDSAYGLQVHGTATVEDGCTMTKLISTASGPIFDIYGLGEASTNGGTVIVNGGTLTSNGDVFRHKKKAAKATVIVNGGTITATPDGDYDGHEGIFFGSSYTSVDDVVTITGGTFIGNFGHNPFWGVVSNVHYVKFGAEAAAARFSDPTYVRPNLADGYELVEAEEDDYWKIAKIPSFTVAAISVDNATVEATNKTAKTVLALPATVLRDTEIAVTVTPAADYEYATTPAGWTKNENGSITTNATVTADLAITVEAPTAAAAPWPVIPEFPADADDEVKAKYAKWAKDHNVTDPAGNSDAFLMNVDPTGDIPELEIKGIEVEGTTATIAVGTDTTDFDLGKINGVLYVESTDELAGEWTVKEYDLPTGDVVETATFTVTTGKFMRAKVGFKDPTK